MLLLLAHTINMRVRANEELAVADRRRGTVAAFVRFEAIGGQQFELFFQRDDVGFTAAGGVIKFAVGCHRGGVVLPPHAAAAAAAETTGTTAARTGTRSITARTAGQCTAASAGAD